MADPGQLEQALINLLKNAAEATHATPQPQLQVSARLSRGGRLRIGLAMVRHARPVGPGARFVLTF